MNLNILPINKGMETYPNKLFLFAGPSGVGKTTMTELVLKNSPDIVFLQKAVTRKQKENEKPGKEVVYFHENIFHSAVETGSLIADYPKYGTWYGLFSSSMKNTKGIDMLKISNCLTIGDAYSAPVRMMDVVSDIVVIVLYSSLDVLIKRIKAKGISPEKEKDRILTVAGEFEAGYPYNLPVCDYLISTDDMPEASGSEVISIIKNETFPNQKRAFV